MPRCPSLPPLTGTEGGAFACATMKALILGLSNDIERVGGRLLRARGRRSSFDELRTRMEIVHRPPGPARSGQRRNCARKAHDPARGTLPSDWRAGAFTTE